jgi:two-component system, NarL family, nitrate/nitrite response regulator NarL
MRGHVPAVSSMTQSSTPRAAIRVIILDGNRMSAELLADALKRDRFDVVYEGSKVAEAVYAAGRADVALVSVTTSEQMNACDVVRQFRSVSPPVQVILMIEEPNSEIVIEAFRAGVRGIFPRSTSVRVLKKCILAVHRGQIWAGNEELNYLLGALTEPRHFRLADARGAELLSKREEDVVRCVAEGLKNREIANELGLSENTVKNYLFRIFDKLGISNRVELILYAFGNMAARLAQPGTAGNGEGDILSTCRDAAQRGTTPEYLLGEMYREGRGIPADKVTSYMWFVIAEAISAEAHKNSRAALADLARELSPKQVAEAKHRAAKWLKNRGRRKAQETTPGKGDELLTKTRAATSHAA